MLRLGDRGDLTFRKSEKKFSSEFLFGLACALSIHALLFFMFRIASSPDLDAIPLLPSTYVEIDLGTHLSPIAMEKEVSLLERNLHPEFPLFSYSSFQPQEFLNVDMTIYSDFQEITSYHLLDFFEEQEDL